MESSNYKHTTEKQQDKEWIVNFKYFNSRKERFTILIQKV